MSIGLSNSVNSEFHGRLVPIIADMSWGAVEMEKVDIDSDDEERTDEEVSDCRFAVTFAVDVDAKDETGH